MNSISELPAIRLASGVEPQQKWPINGKHTETGLRLIDITPTQGNERTVITVVVQAPSFQMPVKLAFNSLMVNTEQMQVQNMTTLVAAVPPFQQTDSETAVVPISICFLNRDVVTGTCLVGEFHYIAKDNSTQREVAQHTSAPINSDHVVPFNTNPNQTTLTVTSAPLVQDYPTKNNAFLNTSDFYSTPSGDPYGTFGYRVPSYYSEPQQTQDQKVIFKDNTLSAHRFKLKSSAHLPSTVANYQPYPGLISRTELDIIGDLNFMTQHWSTGECNEGRRLVQFIKEKDNNKIKCEFKTLLPNNYSKDNIVVSCIYWAEHNNFFITSVDCIYLLEALMGIRFSVEEKNRIRRNLEGFRPLTVSKCKEESAAFFKLIMGFPNPKPRNIEKDVKVFAWNTLPFALKKIITKYTASAFNKSSMMYPPVTTKEHLI